MNFLKRKEVGEEGRIRKEEMKKREGRKRKNERMKEMHYRDTQFLNIFAPLKIAYAPCNMGCIMLFARKNHWSVIHTACSFSWRQDKSAIDKLLRTVSGRNVSPGYYLWEWRRWEDRNLQKGVSVLKKCHRDDSEAVLWNTPW